jgi:prepilin-type N-terminal cleavage/methylation domain-containing protein
MHGDGRCLKGSETGFTLVEVIVTIAMAGVMGALLAATLGNGLSRSSRPVAWTREHYAMQQVVEKMTAVHQKRKDTDGDNALANLKTLIENGTLVDTAQYDVQTKYIAFDADRNEKSTPEGDTMLKVTISRKNDGQKAVVLYTR